MLTPSQREQVKQATNLDVESIELSPQELEERIAPMTLRPASGTVPPA